jgi:hypothetical protein
MGICVYVIRVGYRSMVTHMGICVYVTHVGIGL